MENLSNKIDGKTFEKLLTFGAQNLQANIQEINDLNVFPVPDGDTGTNMYATLAGGVDSLIKESNTDLDLKVGALAEGMLLNARGNSGVILSQLFYGLANGLCGVKEANVQEVCDALKKGVEYAYKAVVNPVEGTILTVAREATEKACGAVDENTSIKSFFVSYLKELKISLEKTPELLEVLKESNVVDSGGAGLVCIIEGCCKALLGEEVASTVVPNIKPFSVGADTNFDQSSKMDYGYCTEVLLQLLDSKQGVEKFDLQSFKDFLTEIGDSIVAVQTGTKVKIHVHTMTPSLVLKECQQYGEFISVKIENMTVQHNNVITKEQKVAPRKKCAIVAVSSGEGFSEMYSEFGADFIVSGGQTDNPSTEEFLKAFKQLNAEKIIVLPNNKNVVLAAKQAGDLYTEAQVEVLPTKCPQQVYSALMVVTDKNDFDSLKSDMTESLNNVESFSITYAVRDAVVGGVKINKDDYMAFSQDGLVLVETDKFECFKNLLSSIKNVGDKEIVTVFYGKTVTEQDKSQIQAIVSNVCSNAEFLGYDGGQEVFPFLIALE